MKDLLGGRPAGRRRDPAGQGDLRLDRREVLKLGGLGLGLAAAPFLAACGGGGNNGGAGASGSGGGGAGKPASIKFQGWDFSSQLVQENINHFMQLHPDIKVDYTPIISAQYVQKMVAEFTAGAEPDALYVYDDSLAGWVGAGYLQPIDGMPDVDKVYGMIYKGPADAMTYQGKRYGLPYYTDTAALAYNADMLQKAGITSPPKSLEELEQQALKVKQAGLLKYPIGVTAQLQDTYWSWWWGLIFASGARLFDSRLQPLMDSSKDTVPRDVLSWLEGAMNRSQVLDPASLQTLPTPLSNAFMAGQYAFILTARYSFRLYNDPAQSRIAGKATIGLIPSLDGRGKGTVSTNRMYCLAKSTRQKEAAFKLMSYLGGLDKDGQPYTAKFWFERQGLGFAFKNLASDPQIKAQLQKFADPAVYAQLAEVARPRGVVSQPWYSQWEAQNQKLIQQVLTRQTSPSAAVKSMADNVRTLQKQYS